MKLHQPNAYNEDTKVVVIYSHNVQKDSHSCGLLSIMKLTDFLSQLKNIEHLVQALNVTHAEKIENLENYDLCSTYLNENVVPELASQVCRNQELWSSIHI
ncbi:unnamed protein product [Clavelina lepadiformis]|uniref:Ubiquitinyl hydrolase 1 n=1 Tax=Clavelina lepadiformis TaxID=159417 RepID=A0ABP0G2B6_CLALP